MPKVVSGPTTRAQPEVVIHDDAVVRAVLPGVRAGLDEIGDDAVAFLLDLLSVPVEYVGGTVIRSVEGEAPRMETDALRQSTDANILDGDPLPKLRISVGPRPGGPVDVATTLENEMNRPFMEPTRIHVSEVAEGLMKSGFRRALPK